MKVEYDDDIIESQARSSVGTPDIITLEGLIAGEGDKGVEAEEYIANNIVSGSTSVPDIHGTSDEFKDETPSPEVSAQPSPVVKSDIIEEEENPPIRDHDFSGIHIIPRGSLNKPTVTEPKPKPKPEPEPKPKPKPKPAKS
ncbi:hypothetical protein ACEPAG_8726 [Sanghuangporus baumii]